MLNSSRLWRSVAAKSVAERSSRTLRVVLPALCAAILCGWAIAPRAARADTTIAGDLDFDVPVSTDYAKTGGGFGIRIGQQLHLPMLVLNPEIGFAYASFADRQSDLGYSGPTIYRGIAGVRLGVGELLRFGLLAHVGFGYVSVDVPAKLQLNDPSHTAFTYDIGLFLDFTLLPLLDIGVHAAYNRVAGKDDLDALQWMQLGAHAALVF
jgi:hypothetical protein